MDWVNVQITRVLKIKEKQTLVPIFMGTDVKSIFAFGISNVGVEPLHISSTIGLLTPASLPLIIYPGESRIQTFTSALGLTRLGELSLWCAEKETLAVIIGYSTEERI